MLRLLLTSIISLSLGVSAVGIVAPKVHAQDATPPATATAPAAPATGTSEPGVGDSIVAEARASAAAKAAGTDTGNPDEKKVLGYDSGGFLEKAFVSVMTTIMTLCAWLLGVAMVMLDNAVLYTVVNMGSYIKGLSAIGVTWEILRNIGNIALIFGFLAIGIATILNANWYGGKQMIPRLIMGAILLNFSLFMAEAVIDVGNFLATNVYTQINGGVPAGVKLSATAPASADASIVGRTTAAVVSAASSVNNEAISSKIMNQLGLQRIYGDALNKNKELLTQNNIPLVAALGILLFIILAFVMFFLSFILITRFIYLIYAIIIAPVGVVGFVIPQFKGVGEDWLKNLITQSMTAPVMFLLLYVALRIITDASFLGFGAPPDYLGFIQDAKGNYNLSGFANILISFFVAIGALLGVIYGTNKFGAFGGKWATKAAGAFSFGAMSFAGRGSLGMLGNAFASKRMQSWARTSSIMPGDKYLKRGIVLAGKGLRSSAFDVRNISTATKGLGAFGIDAGEGAKMTAQQAHEAQYGKKAVKAWFKESADEREKAGREIDFKDAQDNLDTGKITQAQYDAVVAPQVAKMNTKQLEELDGIKRGVASLVKNLSPQQFESILKSDKLNDAQKDKIKDARYEAVDNAVQAGNIPNLKKAMGALSKGELEAMPAKILAYPLVHNNLSDKQRDTLADSKERTATEKDLVRSTSPVGSVEDIFDKAGKGAAGAAAVVASGMLNNLTAPQLAKIDKGLLKEPLIAEKLTTATLIELQEQKKLTPGDMIIIGNFIRASSTANQKTKDYITTGPGAALW